MRASRFRRATPTEEEQLRVEIRKSGAKILFVGLGCPRQEVWVYENAPALDMPMLAVGAAFDLIGGTVPRAPMWMRRRGLEWAFRIKSEPRRLLHRYLATGPRFVAACIRQRVKGTSAAALLTREAIGIERFG
jgi:exopolysaccharide biosynthesis WecB/TagA/CpsF family protein